MEQFAKSILNYFATYTETRFNFRKKIDYKWTNDSLTSDLSVFPQFQRKILSSIKEGVPFNLPISKGEYSVSLDESSFRDELLKKLDSDYGLRFLRSCIEQARDRLKSTESDRVILLGEGSDTEDSIRENKEFENKVFVEGIRQFNLAFRDAVRQVLLGLQKQKVEQLKNELRCSHVPMSSLNPNSIEQDIFEKLQQTARSCEDETSYYNHVKDLLVETSWDLMMYDLYATIRKFMPIMGAGTAYLFFHEILQIKDEEVQSDKYPIFLIELDINEAGNKLFVKSSRDIVVINTPAINSFGFDTILTTPRAARFVDAKPYIGSIEHHLQTSYDLFEEFLLEPAFKPLSALSKPTINFRIGLQVVQNENRKLLDYSELITHIDAGQGGKFIDFVQDYISGNVKNTTDEVDHAYKKRFPKKSVNNLLSTIPLSLNKPQKRILTALDNSKNRVIVVDGPPGTGKSYTIAAITYWANQKNKSVVITSHKTAALDVIDRMLTDKFKELHPQTKPSILRISKDDRLINSYQNTLAGPVVSGATNRTNQFNEEAVNKDKDTWNRTITSQLDECWRNSSDYKENIERLFRLEQIENWLEEQNVQIDGVVASKLNENDTIDFELIQKLASRIEQSGSKDIRLAHLSFVVENYNSIDRLLNACNTINGLSVSSSDAERVRTFTEEEMNNVSDILSEIGGHLSRSSLVFADEDSLSFKVLSKISLLNKSKAEEFKQKIKQLNSLECDNIIGNICLLLNRDKESLTVIDLQQGLNRLKEVLTYWENIELLKPSLEELGFDEQHIKEFYHFLNGLNSIGQDISSDVITSLTTLQKYFSELLKNIDIDFNDLSTLGSLFSHDGICQKVFEYIQLFVELSKVEFPTAPAQDLVSDYYASVHKQLENINDKRCKNLNNFAGDIERIIVAMRTGKRLTSDQLKVLLDNISCIISSPALISKYFPMQEDSIDVLVIDEASQVSIADSISLILRAKQVVVFGDELQYGAVSAVNVSKQYSEQYFREILESYASDYNISIDEGEKNRIADDASSEIDDEDMFLEPIYVPEDGTQEWLKTFSIRTSTLNFAKALKNFSTSLDTHFRSFTEIIDYSNEFFYKQRQIPLIVNRIRTKPIKEVLRFIPVTTQGHSGNNVNLDEIEAIKNDIQNLIDNGFKGTIGIITSFREQKYKMEEVLRKELPRFHYLQKDQKLTIWFVGEVQGEERDIVYYSFVEDKQLGNANLGTIYPTIGGSADTIRSLKMQRLNVGFSRAKDTMVFVHSMPIEDYSNTRLGDALKHYWHILDTTIDNYVEDESVFESPMERELYLLITQTDFYKSNRDKIKLIAQFPIGKYIESTYHRYIPKYRADFLMTLSDHGTEKSLILEYDGVEYHTKNPSVVTEHNFSQEYLDYDIERQLELQSYGYKFLRINKFTLVPKQKGQTKLEVLGLLLENSFQS